VEGGDPPVENPLGGGKWVFRPKRKVEQTAVMGLPNTGKKKMFFGGQESLVGRKSALGGGGGVQRPLPGKNRQFPPSHSIFKKKKRNPPNGGRGKAGVGSMR